MEGKIMKMSDEFGQSNEWSEKIKEQAYFLKAVTDTNPDMISVINLQTNELEFINTSAFINHGFGSTVELFEKGETLKRRGAIHPDHSNATLNYFSGFSELKDEETQNLEYQAINDTGELNWYFAHGKVFKRNVEGIPTHAISIVRKITEQKKTQQEIKDTKDLLQSIIDVSLVGTSFYRPVYNENGNVVDFEWVLSNKKANEYGGTNSLVGKRWSEQFPGIRENGVLQKMISVVETGQTQDLEFHYQSDGYDHWFRLIGVKLADGLLTSSEDITLRKKAERELKDQAHFIKNVTDMMPDVVSVVEFPSRKILYTNRDTLTWLGFDQDDLSKMSFEHRVKLFHPDDVHSIQDFYKRFHLLKDREENRVEYRLKNKKDEWVLLSVRAQVFKRDLNGNPTELLFAGQNVTELRKAEQEILRLKDEIAEKATDKYYSLFNSIDEGFCLSEVVFEGEKIVDLLYLEVNEAYLQVTGQPDPSGKRLSQLRKDLKPEFEWLEGVYNVIKTGKPWRTETFVEDTQRWYSSYLTHVGGEDSKQIAILFNDVTDRKHNEKVQEYLLILSDALQSIDDPIEIQEIAAELLGKYLKASRSFYYEINWTGDDQYVCIVNKDYCFENIPSLTGKYPWKVLEKDLFEKLYRGETLIINDIDKADILSPEERKAHHATGTLSYITVPFLKDGKYIAGMNVQCTVSRLWTNTEIIIAEETAQRTWAAVERGRAELSLRELNENLERQVQERTEQLSKLKIEQEKARLNAILLGQEQERSRIAEGLHNGVAQLLFAVQSKLQSIEPIKEKEKLTLTSAVSILSDAMRDTRNISFELMPPVLKDYGIKVAIENFIQKVFIARNKIRLEINLTERLSESLEISIYRIVQEILSNIGKHSDASEAVIKISANKKNIMVKAEDNGKGFVVKEAMNLQKGMGLQNIENRVKLLDGKMKIKSKPNKGTIIEIQLPVGNKRS